MKLSIGLIRCHMSNQTKYLRSIRPKFTKNSAQISIYISLAICNVY